MEFCGEIKQTKRISNNNALLAELILNSSIQDVFLKAVRRVTTRFREISKSQDIRGLNITTLWNLANPSVVMLPRCQLNFRAMRWL